MKRTMILCIALIFLCAFAVCAASPSDVLYGQAYVEWNETQIKAWIDEHPDQTDLLTVEKHLTILPDIDPVLVRYQLALDTETQAPVFILELPEPADSYGKLSMLLQPNGMVKFSVYQLSPEFEAPVEGSIQKKRSEITGTEMLDFFTDHGGTRYPLGKLEAIPIWDSILENSCGLHLYQLGFYLSCPNHKLVTYKVEDASCTENGTEYMHCETCREDVSVSIPGGVHVYGEPVTVKEPSCMEDGLQTETCTRCGYVLETVLPAFLTHTYMTYIMPATTVKDGFEREECAVCGETWHERIIPRIASITLSATEYNYNGKAKRPKVTIKDRTGAEITDYTVRYAKGRKMPGVYPVHICMTTDFYAGDYVEQFTIAPARATGLKVAGKKLTWTKVDTAQKYVVYYRIGKKGDFKKLRSTTKTAVSLKKLETGKTIYFKVRTYFRDPTYNITIWGKYSPAVKAKLK